MSTMRCQNCIKDNIWILFFPKSLLEVCSCCKELGIRNRKIYRYGLYFSITMYLIVFYLAYYFKK